MNITEHSAPHTAGADPVEIAEEAGLAVEFVAAGTIRAIEVVAAVLLGLLVCPPLLILVVVVVVPLVAFSILIGLIVLTLALPYLIVRHFHGHRGHHTSLLVSRLHRLRTRHV